MTDADSKAAERAERIRARVAGFYRRAATSETIQGKAEQARKLMQRQGQPKRVRRGPPLEREEQREVLRWCRQHKIHVDANLEGAKRDWRQRISAKAQGMRRGRPDLEIKSRVPGRPDIRGVAIEMKRQKPYDAELTDEQRVKLERLRADGYATHVAYGAADAIAWLRSLGFGG